MRMARGLVRPISNTQIRDLYDASVHDSVRRLGCAWLEQTPTTPTSARDPVRDTLRDSWDDIPIEVDLPPPTPASPTTSEPEGGVDEKAPLRGSDRFANLRLALLAAFAGFVVMTSLLAVTERTDGPVRATLERAWQAVTR
jgi:hypothetical protein